MAKKKMYSVGCRIYYLTDEQVEFGKALLEQLRHKVSIELEPAEIFGFTEDKEEDSQSSFFYLRSPRSDVRGENFHYNTGFSFCQEKFDQKIKKLFFTKRVDKQPPICYTIIVPRRWRQETDRGKKLKKVEKTS